MIVYHNQICFVSTFSNVALMCMDSRVVFAMNIHKETAVDELFFTINHRGDWETCKNLIVSQLVASRLERLRMMQCRYIWQTEIKHQCVLHYLCKYSDLTGLYILKGLSLEKNLLVSTGSTQNNKDIKRVNDEKLKHMFLPEEGGDQN